MRDHRVDFTFDRERACAERGGARAPPEAAFDPIELRDKGGNGPCAFRQRDELKYARVDHRGGGRSADGADPRRKLPHHHGHRQETTTRHPLQPVRPRISPRGHPREFLFSHGPVIYTPNHIQ